MKGQVSPATAVLAVVLTFGTVLGLYWKGLLSQKEGEGPAMMGGAGGPPPPPVVGLTTVTVTTLAGPQANTLSAGDGGLADGTGTAARFDGPSAIAFGPGGALYITDSRNHRIRRMTPAGVVDTVAGSGPTSAMLGALADGSADQSRFWNPSGLALMPGGQMLIADTGNHRIRVLAGGKTETIAGSETPQDRLGLADGGLRDGPGAQAQFRYPLGVAALPDGSALVADAGNCRLRRIAPDRTVSTYANLQPAGAISPCAIAVKPDGTALVADPASENIFVVSPSGAVSALPGINKDAPIWREPAGIATDGANIFIAATGSHCIMRIRPGGAPEILAGVVPIEAGGPGYTNGTGDATMFAAPCGIAVAPGGVLYVADYGNNCIRKVVIPPGV